MRVVASMLLLLIGLKGYSQAISGRIVAQDGEALIGAHIYSIANWRDGAITDSEGKFELVLSTPSDSVVVSYVGFEERVMSVSDLEVIILKELAKSAGTVVVEAKSLVAEEFRYMELDRMDMYKNPSAQADPLLAVNMLPAATTIDESANISLRGSSPFETGVYLNGVPIYDAVRYAQLNGLGTFSIFSPSILKSVDVFPGNPPIELGNSTSGAISLTTDEKVVDEPLNSLVLSLANVGISREQPLGDNSSLKLFSNWQMSNAFKSLNGEALEDVERFNSNDLGLYYYAALGKLNVKVVSYSMAEGYTVQLDHPSYQGSFDLKKRRNFTVSTVEMPLASGTLALQKGFSFSRGAYTYSSADFEVDKTDLFVGLNYQRRIGNFQSKAGLSFDSRNSEVDGALHQFSYAIAQNHPLISLNESSGVKVLDAYAYTKFLASDKITFGAGIRKNLPTKQVPGYTSAQLNAAYVTGNWKISTGIGSYFKHGLEENTGEAFNSQADQASVDVQWSKRKTLASAGLFFKRGEVQSEEYTATGLELYVDHRFSSKLRTSGTVTLLNAESEGSVYRYDPSYFIRHSLTFAAGRMWEFNSNLLIREGSATALVNQANFNQDLQVYIPGYSETPGRTSPYANLSLGVSKFFPISDQFNMIGFCSVNNLLDRSNVRSFSYNTDYSQRQAELFSQRTIYFGLVLNF